MTDTGKELTLKELIEISKDPERSFRRSIISDLDSALKILKSNRIGSVESALWRVVDAAGMLSQLADQGTPGSRRQSSTGRGYYVGSDE